MSLRYQKRIEVFLGGVTVWVFKVTENGEMVVTTWNYYGQGLWEGLFGRGDDPERVAARIEKADRWADEQIAMLSRYDLS